jgi:hypothetical protein
MNVSLTSNSWKRSVIRGKKKVFLQSQVKVHQSDPGRKVWVRVWRVMTFSKGSRMLIGHSMWTRDRAKITWWLSKMFVNQLTISLDKFFKMMRMKVFKRTYQISVGTWLQRGQCMEARDLLIMKNSKTHYARINSLWVLILWSMNKVWPSFNRKEEASMFKVL